MATASSHRAAAVRHLLCQKCGYDLFGIAARAACDITCPECGETFDRRFLNSVRRGKEWTLATGIRDASVFLMTRFVMVLPFVVGALYLVHWSGQWFRGRNFSLALAIPLGIVFARRFSEKAGFESALLYAAMFAACIGITYAADVTIQLTLPTQFYVALRWQSETALFAVTMASLAMWRMWSES